MPIKEEDKRDIQRALAKLQAVRCALAVYKRDHGGSFPEKLESLIPKYLSHIPEIKLPGHEQTKSVVNVDNEMPDDKSRATETGGWAYFASKRARNHGEVMLDCQHVFRYKKLCEY